MPVDLLSELTASPWYSGVVLPLSIFLARTLDMSLSTLRITFVAQGRSLLAPIFGFFESLIWLMIIGQVLQHIDNPLCTIAYAGGFAAGNSLGLFIERRMAVGHRILRIFTTERSEELARLLRRAGVGVTVVDGQGAQGPVQILFSLVRRRDLERMLTLVQRHDPAAVYSVEDVRQAAERVYPALRLGSRRRSRILRRSQRKSK